MPGQYSLLEFAKYFNIDLSDEQHTKFTTLAGLVINKSNEVPKNGDKIEVDNYLIEVIYKDRQKIDKLLLTQL